MNTNDPIYTAAEAAKITGQSLRTVQHHARRYGLGKRFGGKVYMLGQQDIETLQAITRREWDGDPVTEGG
jgi:hypothetical protein